MKKNEFELSEDSNQIKFAETQFLEIFSKQLLRSTVGMMLVGLFIFFILINKINIYITSFWIVILLSALSFRYYALKKISNFNVKKAFNWIAFSFVVHGLIFGFILLTLDQSNLIEFTMISMTLFVIVIASVATTNGFKRLYLWINIPVLLSICLAWIHITTNLNLDYIIRYIFCFLLIYLFIFLIGLAGDLNIAFRTLCKMKYLEQLNSANLLLALEVSKNASLAKTRFLASASHDLRQPMHTIGVLLATLSMRRLDDRSREIVNVLGTVNASLASQLDGLLDISKLDAGVVTPDFQVYRLDELVHRHASKIVLTEKKKDLYVHVHADKEVRVRTDAVLFDRILMNLIGNAIKFTEKGGVDITLSTTNEKAILEVADTGIGIADSFQSLVFQEFYQVGNPERDRSAGLGLGLSIVQRLCTILDIHLHLISAPGQGSRFVLSMPLLRDNVALSMKREYVPSSPLPPMNVLVIDDEIDIRTGMRLLLEEMGCTVVLADGISQAVAAVKLQKFNVVFSDYRLRGDENGIDAIGHVRVIQPDLYAVLITGDTAAERLQSAIKAGIPMLHKPVSFEAIVKQLHLTALKQMS